MKLVIKTLHAIMKINTFEINFNMTLKNMFKKIQWKLRHYEIK